MSRSSSICSEHYLGQRLLLAQLGNSLPFQRAKILVVGPLVLLSQMFEPGGEVEERSIAAVWARKRGVHHVAIAEVGGHVRSARREKLRTHKYRNTEIQIRSLARKLYLYLLVKIGDWDPQRWHSWSGWRLTMCTIT